MTTIQKVQPSIPFAIGQRVETHPATDAWMQGDRFGEVVGYGRSREYVDTFTREHAMTRPVRVKMDRSGRVLRFHPSYLSEV